MSKWIINFMSWFCDYFNNKGLEMDQFIEKIHEVELIKRTKIIGNL